MMRKILNIIVFTGWLGSLSCLGQTDNYWQQQVDFLIEAKLDTSQRMLHGFEQVTYRNNSPDTLHFIYFHLWPNAFSTRSTPFAKQKLEDNSRGFHFLFDERKSSIDSLDFQWNNLKLDWRLLDSPDICEVILAHPLVPGAEIVISTPFRVKIPVFSSRFGLQDGKYFINHWYPKPAVYDADGWHTYSYLDLAELYNDFGIYRISITVPKHVKIAATGMVERRHEDETHVKLTFAQDQVHDFAFVASSHFFSQDSLLILTNGQQVKTSIYYTPDNQATWTNAFAKIANALNFYIEHVGDYPHASLTLAEGRGGMEYPTLAVVDGYSGQFRFDQSLVHEIGHCWFFGALGTNQRKHMWMDEGIVTYYEFKYINQLHPKTRIFGLDTDAFPNHLGLDLMSLFSLKEFSWHDSREALYQLLACRNRDQPITTPAQDFTPFNYRFMGYLKASLVLELLQEYLGEDVFRQAMREYYNQWKFRHPDPDAMRNCLERITGQSLHWFFKELLDSRMKLDAAIRYSKSNKEFEVLHRRKSNMPLHVSEYQDTLLMAGYWVKKFPHRLKTSERVNRIGVDTRKSIPEIDRSNNELIRKGHRFKNEKHFSLKFLASLENGKQHQLYFMPVVGANTTDKFMAGLSLYNTALLEKRINFQITPFYSFANKTWQGSVNARINVGWPSSSTWAVVGHASQFSVFKKAKLGIQYSPKLLQKRNPPKQLFTLAHHYLETDMDRFQECANFYQVGQLKYEYQWLNALNRLDGFAMVESDYRGFSKVTAEMKYTRQFLRNRYFSIRGYVGKVNRAANTPEAFYLHMNGSRDYLFEETYFDRAGISSASTAFTRQTDLREGGFRSPNNLVSDNWLVAINTQFEIPAIPFLAVYAEWGKAEGLRPAYAAGLSLNAVRNFFEVYVPFYASAEPGIAANLTNNIRFTFKLQTLNPFKILDQAIR